MYIVLTLSLSVTRVKFRIGLEVRNVIHIVHVSQVCTLLNERLANSPISTAQLAHTKVTVIHSLSGWSIANWRNTLGRFS